MARASPRISAVEVLARDPGLCRIRVGERWIGPLRRDDAERLGLCTGERLTRRRRVAAELLIATAEARRRALVALGRGPRSLAALRARLERRGLDPAAVSAALAQLQSDGWVSEERSAQERLASMQRRMPIARAAIEAALDREGFAEESRRRAISECNPSDLEAAHTAAAASLARGASPVVVARRLARRGFEIDIIRQALARCGHSLDDDA